MGFSERSISKPDSDPNRTTYQLSEIIKNLREAVLIVGENLRVAAVNRAAAGVFERASENLVDQRLSEVIRNVSIHNAFNNAFEKNKSTRVKIETRLSANRSFDVTVTPIELDETKSAIAVFYETTQIVHLERVRQEFLSNVSHELRTPLTSILAFVETLESGGIDDNCNNVRFLGIIRKNAERMRHLIDDLSELSSIESGRIEINPVKIDLARLVDDIFANLSAKAEDRKIRLVNEISDDGVVAADIVRMEQMLTNLIDNAIKFNRANGKVVVRFKSGESVNSIEISDTGEGIDAGQIPRIFERLYRADRSRTSEVGGTGLGLAIVKHLARLHNGEILVKSASGKGSTFTIELPTEI